LKLKFINYYSSYF